MWLHVVVEMLNVDICVAVCHSFFHLSPFSFYMSPLPPICHSFNGRNKTGRDKNSNPLLPFKRRTLEAQVYSQDPYLQSSAQKAKMAMNLHQKLEILWNISSQVTVFNENLLTRPCFHSNLPAHKSSSLEIWAALTYQKNEFECPSIF